MKNITKIFPRHLLVCAIVSPLFSLAEAGSIGVNVGPNDGTIGEGDAAKAPENNELPAGTTAGVVPQANWNNLLGGSFNSPVPLTDDSGTLLATTATVSTSWTNSVQDHGSTDGDQILMNGGLDNGGGPLTSRVAGIPYPEYEVYIYFDGGGSDNRIGDYSVVNTDTNETLATQVGSDGGSFSGTFVESTGAQDGDMNFLPANYVRFTGLTATNITIQSIARNTRGDGTSVITRAPWNGFQIVEAGFTGGGGDLEITAISYDDTADSATLTWRANASATYSVFASTDLEDWTSEVAAGVDSVADEDQTDEGFFTTTIDLPTQGFTSASKLFFRVEEAN